MTTNLSVQDIANLLGQLATTVNDLATTRTNGGSAVAAPTEFSGTGPAEARQFKDSFHIWALVNSQLNLKDTQGNFTAIDQKCSDSQNC